MTGICCVQDTEIILKESLNEEKFSGNRIMKQGWTVVRMFKLHGQFNDAHLVVSFLLFPFALWTSYVLSIQ